MVPFSVQIKSQHATSILRRGLRIAFYVVLAILFTWPSIARLGSHIPGMDSDAYVHLWTFDWVGRAIANGQLTLHTNDLFYPVGVSLLSHNIAWFNIAIWLFLKLFLGSAAAYTAAALLLLAFNGYALYLLARDLVDSEYASLLAGVIGTTWPFITTHLHHPNLIAIGFVPLAIKHTRRLILEGRKRDLILAALFIGLIGIVRLQLLTMSVFLICPYSLYLLIASRRFKSLRLWGQLALVIAIACIILMPVIAPLAWYQSTRTHSNDLFTHSSESTDGQADPVYYLIPNGFHPLWGKLLREKLDQTPFNAQFHIPFVGYTVLLLSLWGATRRRKQGSMWALSAILLMALAIGPVLVIGDREILTPPYADVYRQILIPVLRYPERFNVLLSIPFSILAAIGSAHLWRKWKTSTQIILCAATMSLVVFEYAIYPFPRLSLSTPDWYNELARQEEEFGIVEIPMNRQTEEQYMLYQLTHRKSLVEGHVSRPPREASSFIASVPLLNHLDWHNSRLPPYEDINISEQLYVLHKANLRYLILHREFLTESQIAAWRRWLIMAPYHEDDQVIVYKTDPTAIESAVSQAPQLKTNIQLVQTQFIPTQTVQTGWVELPTHWFVSSKLNNSQNALCIALLDKENEPLQESCDYRILNVPEGDHIEPGLLFTVYLVQIPPFAKAGNHQVIFYHPATDRDTLANSAVPAGNVTVKALPRQFDPPTPSHYLDITYEDEIALVGYDAEQTNTALRSTLYWKALKHPSTSYKIFIHLINETTGEFIAQKDYVPCEWQYPTEVWQAGEYVRDYIVFDLSDIPPGKYEVQVGMYRPESKKRLVASPMYPEHAVSLMRIEHCMPPQ